MGTILMQFPNASEINKLYDGRRHTIEPLKLFEVTINGDNYYVLGFRDSTFGEDCMTLLKKINNRFVKVPLRDYTSFADVMNSNNIKETNLGILNDVLEIDCAPITTIEEIVTPKFSNEEDTLFHIEEIPRNENHVEEDYISPDAQTKQETNLKEEIKVVVLTWRDGFDKKYAIYLDDYNMLFFDKEEKQTFEYDYKKWAVINKRLLNFLKDKKDIRIITRLRKPYFYKQVKEKQIDNESENIIPIYISNNKWSKEALFVDIDLYERTLGDFDFSRTTKTVIYDGIEHSVVEVYEPEIRTLEKRLKAKREIIKEEKKEEEKYFDEAKDEVVISFADENEKEGEKEQEVNEEDPNQLYFAVYEDNITGKHYIKQALYKIFISEDIDDALSILENDLSVLITEVTDEEIKKIEEATKTKRNIILGFKLATYSDDDNVKKDDIKK